eukprot:TRINITY_DN16063_c0_g1_i1.p1 TRINITY_DN16063_c0_g1~~TRINITY_DN16063_c0_g1_i1.p1  ORF type:complete len:143 (-),score=11.29 TRINITY_DN16063_c0_g1_i1:171-545(-)
MSTRSSRGPTPDPAVAVEYFTGTFADLQLADLDRPSPCRFEAGSVSTDTAHAPPPRHAAAVTATGSSLQAPEAVPLLKPTNTRGIPAVIPGALSLAAKLDWLDAEMQRFEAEALRPLLRTEPLK